MSWRVPSDLAAHWDRWLGDFTLVARDAAGDAWPEIWLTAPVWHFAIGAGVVADYPVCGLLIASVDRVGRMFPFTIIGASGGEPEEAWSLEAEAAALAALPDDADLAALQACLTKLGPPRSPGAVGAGTSHWHAREPAPVTPSRFATAGLPTPAASRAMIIPGGSASSACIV